MKYQGSLQFSHMHERSIMLKIRQLYKDSRIMPETSYVKGNVHPQTGHERPEKEREREREKYNSTLSLASALDVGGWLTPRPGRFTPGKESR